MSYKKNELNKLHKTLYEILKKTISIFEENNIKYTLIGGTALGAYRHSGIIPWDDDIDIVVLEEDIKKINSLKDTFMKENLFVQNFQTEKNTPYYFTKIRLNNTVFEEKVIENLSIHKGVFIDIFPLREVRRYGFLYLINYFFFRALVSVFSAKVTTYSSSLKIKFYKTLIFAFTIPITRKQVFWILSNFFKTNGSNWLGYCQFKKQFFKKNDFENRKKVKFGDHYYFQLNNVENYLRSMYGKDFNKIPPLNKRINHKPKRLEL